MKTKQLIIVGGGETAELAYYYFQQDSEFEVVAFSIEQTFLDTDTLHGLPVRPLENIENEFPPSKYYAFVAVSSTKLNTVRTKLYRICKEKGYKLASYISSRAYVGVNVSIGDNCFIQEDNTIQSFVTIGNNVTLWAGNHVGHRTIIHDNCFITSHVVLSGFCEVGAYSFIGVNTSVADKVKIGEKCLIGLGSIIGKDVSPNSIMKMPYAKTQPIAATAFMNVDDFDF